MGEFWIMGIIWIIGDFWIIVDFLIMGDIWIMGDFWVMSDFWIMGELLMDSVQTWQRGAAVGQARFLIRLIMLFWPIFFAIFGAQ